ncbi:SAV_2336 N-terminal domain-related protein [Streptomyces sp. NPDC086549]|uniref:SAV_2336 N-terminal domain-related protein n=1 Tax=Streptomyces sp. NPDC086549 TaxID=3365752 RepID=UPI0038104AD5
MSDALTRLLRVLGGALPPGADARTLVDALWLAASGSEGHGAPSTHAVPTDEAAPVPEAGPAAQPAGHAPQGARRVLHGAEGRELSVRRPGAVSRVRGVPLTLGRGSPLPDALAVGRAVQPFRLPWRHGGRTRLDIDATVEHYARGGPLVPMFRPAPEPWFEAVVLVDSSLSMTVWEETTRAVTGLLRNLGGFRAVHTWRLDWHNGEPLVQDHHGSAVPGDRVPHHGSGPQGRRLVLLVSDCAARGWHTPAPWLLLRDWGGQIPVALLDPLPPRLWRRSALNLPAVRVSGAQCGDHNGGLRFRLPPRLRPGVAGEDALGTWSALPVVSCTPHSLGAWASTLMRADPRGCDAVLIPATGRLPQTRTGTAPARQADPERLAEAFVHTAPAPAVRLAVLGSSLPELPLPLLHVLRDQAVPEARYADLAEMLTSGLFMVRREPDGDPVLVFHAAAQEYLRTFLTTHDAWQVERAFSRHVAAHPYAPHGIATVLHDPAVAGELPAEVRPFAKAVTAVRRILEPVRVPGDMGTEEPVAGPDSEVYAVYSRVRQRMRTYFDQTVEGHARPDAESLLRHLIDYVHSRLPVPLGDWPRESTYFDELRADGGEIRLRDVVGDLRLYPGSADVVLQRLALPGHKPGHDLVWHAAGGPVHVKVRTSAAFSWAGVTADVHREFADGTRPSSPVDFFMILDTSDKPEGLHHLSDCVAMIEPEPGRGDRAAVVLRLQTRHGSGSNAARAALATALRVLLARAGSPSYAEIVREAARESPPVQLSGGSLARWFAGRAVPAGERDFTWLTGFLTQRSGQEGGGALSPAALARLLDRAREEARREASGPPATSSLPTPLGVPVGELADPTVLGVHPVVMPSGFGDEEASTPAWPPYIAREIDQLLHAVLQDCAERGSRLVMVVGAAGSGKSRLCWEALHILPPTWRVWQPRSSADLEEVLSAPTSIGPRTVIWLDDAQRHLLDVTGGRGERVAEALLELLRRPRGGPVLILGSLRDEYWNVVGSVPLVPPAVAADPHRHARELLAHCTHISVHSQLSPAERARFSASTGIDPRLDDAVTRAQDGKVIPYLASGDAQIERLASAPPAAHALVLAAVDALRCGHGPRLPLALLEAAVPGYLTDEQRDGLDDGWIHSAVEYLTPFTRSPLGVAGLLSRDHTRPGEGASASPCYRLSDHIERFGRATRARHAPPDDLWEALAAHASGPDLEAVARTAEAQGDHRRAARFRGLARRAGDSVGADADLTESGARALRSLLQRTDLPQAEARAAVEQALDWLRAGGRTENAQFVLNGLLMRDDLSAEEVSEAVRSALDWLAVHGDTPAAQFVLGRLLARTDLGELDANQAVVLALDWLRVLGDTQWAQYVLRPVLLRGDLTNRQAHLAAQAALKWLSLHGNAATSQFVLSAALRRDDLAPEPRTGLVEAAMGWIRDVGNSEPAKFVLRPLLQRSDLTSEEAGPAREAALDWLRTHGGSLDAQFVLNAVLYRDDLTAEEAREAADRALEWLRTHGADESAWYVQRPLRLRTDLSADVTAQLEGMQAAGSRLGGGAGPAEPRWGVILVADIERLPDDDTSSFELGQAHRRLHDILARVLRDVAPQWQNWDSGDGTIVFLPGMFVPRAVDLLRRLRRELDDPFWDRPPRLRIALHCGDVVMDQHGPVGRAVVTATRLADAPALRSALRSGVRSPLAVVISDDMVSYGGLTLWEETGPFRPVEISTKGETLRAWICVPGYAQPPGIAEWERHPEDDAAE